MNRDTDPMNPTPTKTSATTQIATPGGEGDSGDEAVFCERFETLEAGRYWRAAEAIDEFDIPAGQVLLIESIRWVDNEPHTIILRPHPTSSNLAYYRPDRNGYRFRVQDFLDVFEFEPDGEAIRERELQEAQQDIQDEQARLSDAQSSPEALRAAMREDGFLESSDSTDIVAHRDLGKTARSQSLPAILSKLDSEEALTALVGSANRVRDEAEAQSKWLTHRVEVIQGKVQQLTPFFEEKAAAALAATEDVRSDVEGIMRGLQTLGLFVGTDVDMEQIVSGDPAPEDAPLTFQQRRLYANEELAVFRTVSDDFDVREEWRLFDALASEPALVDQIFTSERAVVMMAVRRDALRYGEGLEGFLESLRYNRQNLATFFLVRNGGNIYRVFSPETSHERADHLFPLEGEQDRLFRGSESEWITFDDVRYTDSLEAHERFLIHYRRVLILLFGLQMRKGILGDFCPPDELGRFLSLEFQERYFRFIRDAGGDGSALGDGRPSFHAWRRDNHAKIRHGSLVMGEWRVLMSEEAAPAAHNVGNVYKPVERIGCARVDMSSGTPKVKIPVEGFTSDGRPRKFNCTVELSDHVRANTPCLVCLDDVSVEELHYYIHNRTARDGVISHMSVFSKAIRYLEAAAPDWLESAVEAMVAYGAPQSLAQRLAYLRARTGSGDSLPEAAKRSLCRLAEWCSPADGAVKDALGGVNGELARLELNPVKGVLQAYLEPSDGDVDDRLQPFSWYRAITLKPTGKGLRMTGDRWERRDQPKAGGLPILGDTPSPDRLNRNRPVFSSPAQKAKFFDEIESLASPLCAEMLQPKDAGSLVDAWLELTQKVHRNNRSRMVRNIVMGVPIGAIRFHSSASPVCIGLMGLDAVAYLDVLTAGAMRQQLKNAYVRRFADMRYQAERFDEAIESFDPGSAPWQVFSVEPDGRRGCFWPRGIHLSKAGRSLMSPQKGEAKFVFGRRPENAWVSPCTPDVAGRILGASGPRQST